MKSLKSEKMQLVMQLESAREMNKELMGDEATASCSHNSVEENERRSCDEDVAESSHGPQQSKTEGTVDAMEVPRIKRRLAQMENELKRTRTKLLSSQSTLKVCLCKPVCMCTFKALALCINKTLFDLYSP